MAFGGERRIQRRGFRPKQHDRPDRRECCKLTRPAIVGDQQLSDVKQAQQLSNRAGVTRQVNDGACCISAFDIGYQLLRQRLVFLQTNHRHRAAVLHQTVAQRRIGIKWPRPYRQNTATGVDKYQWFACNARVVAGQALANFIDLMQLQLHMRWCLGRQHHGQF